MFFKIRKKKYNIPPNDEKRLRHIAFIMDGNGRWAQSRGMPRSYGHSAGAATFKKIIEYCGKINIEAITVYAFSTENRKRPKAEIDAIFKLFKEYLDLAEKNVHEKNIQLHFLGDKNLLSQELKSRMEYLEDISKNNVKILNIAINYGGRDEIVHAVNELIKEGKKEITEDDITAHLYTKDSPPLDLIVRTGAEKRISNFLLWQAAYAELYFTDVLWPDMTEKDIDAAVNEFYSRKRRFGGI